MRIAVIGDSPGGRLGAAMMALLGGSLAVEIMETVHDLVNYFSVWSFIALLNQIHGGWWRPAPYRAANQLLAQIVSARVKGIRQPTSIFDKIDSHPSPSPLAYERLLGACSVPVQCGR